jgi:replicative DNA helicase
MTEELTLGWEKAVIGTVLVDPEAMEVASDLEPVDFSRSHKMIWHAVLGLHHRNSLELRALIEELRANDDLNFVGSDIGNPEITGENYIADLTTYQGTQIEEYCKQVIDSSTRRQLREMSALTAADALTSNDPIEDLLDEAERRLMALRRTRNVSGVSLGTILQALMPNIDGVRAGEIEPAWVPDLLAVKDIVQFVDQSDFVIVAGRPGDGKSSYMRYEAYHTVMKGAPILTFNLENTEVEYGRWAIALHTGIDGKKIRSPKLLSNRELERVKIAAEELAALPWEIVTLGSPSVADMERIARAKMRMLNPVMIQVDYLQLVNNGIQKKVNDVSLTSQTLRAWAMANRFNIPVMAASQLSRGIEGRGPLAEPQLSDLRDSGSIEQDGTIIIFPRGLWTNPTPTELRRFNDNVDHDDNLYPVWRAVPVRFYVKKNRNGPVGISDVVKWSKYTGNYQTLERGFV